MATKKPFLPVPGFSKYEFNGTICRNATSKVLMGLKKKNGKYQLISDDKKNIDKSPQQLKELVFPVIKEPQQPAKKSKKSDENNLPGSTEKKTRVKKEKELIAPEAGSEFETILTMDIFKKEKIVRLHLAGATNQEIEQFLGTNQGWIWNELNNYKENPDKFKI